MMKLFFWILLLLGLCVMALMALTNGTVEVSNVDCLNLWNETVTKPAEMPPSGTGLRVLGEDEQDLGYGLCHLFWQDDEGGCRSLSARVWDDTETWESDSIVRCQNSDVGRAAGFDQSRLVLVDE